MVRTRDVIHYKFNCNFPIYEIFMDNLALSSFSSKFFTVLSTTYLTFGHCGCMAGYLNFTAFLLLCYQRKKNFKKK